jgi:hypothetical protein
MRNPTHGRTLALIAVAALSAGAFSIQPVRATIESVMTCSQSTPCLQWTNSGSGNAVLGISNGGNAIDGRTKFKSAGKSAGKAGVLGEDVSATGSLDTGVQGTSVNGTGVTGTSTNLNGVTGFTSGNASGVYGQSNAAGGYGIAGRNVSSTHDNNGAAVLADGSTASDGIHAFANGSNNAIYAFSQNGSALLANQGPNNPSPELSLEDTSSASNPFILATGPNAHDAFEVNDVGMLLGGFLQIQPASGIDAFVLEAGSVGTGEAVMQVYDHNFNALMGLSDQGNMFISGHLTTGSDCSTGCDVAGKRVRSLTEYAPRETVPTMEDLGEGQLTDGRAVVALDPKFASAIDQHANYLVFLTPEGDCRGLYVAQKTSTSFTVMELQGGRSTLQFDYRIVAKPYGDNAPRLPMTVARPSTLPRSRAAMRTLYAPHP